MEFLQPYFVAPIPYRETVYLDVYHCPFPFINEVPLIDYDQPWYEVGHV